jgi:hypothetical protein
MMTRMSVIVGAAIASGCSVSAADATSNNIDRKADALLREMSNQLAAARAFQFDADHELEAVTKQGEKLQFVARSRVSVQRPDKLRSDRLGAIIDATLYYDGKTITIHGKRLNLYAAAPAPNTIDAAIDFARDKLGLEAPAGDVVYSDAYAGLMQDVVSGTYLGSEPVGDRMCHHLAFRERGTDWQMWIEDSPRALPCRYVITSSDVTGSPEFTVAFSNWNLSPTFPASEFEFTPPSGATRIDFLSLKGATPRRSKQQ